MKLERVHRCRVALHVDEQLAGLEIPDLDERVVANRRDPLVVRAETQRVDGVRVALVGEYARLATQVPQLQQQQQPLNPE